MKKDTLIPIGMLVLGVVAGYLLAMQTMPAMTPESSHNSEMERAMHQMTSGLEGKAGDAFDRAFLEEMIVHHEGAIQMAKQLLSKTTRPELQTLGNDIITAQVKEVEMMHGWLHDWYNAQDKI